MDSTNSNKDKGKQDSFGNVLRGFLINRYETKFIYPHNLYSMTSRLEDMKIARQNEVK
jgi:hypothetical protein